MLGYRQKLAGPLKSPSLALNTSSDTYVGKCSTKVAGNLLKGDKNEKLRSWVH